MTATVAPTTTVEAPAAEHATPAKPPREGAELAKAAQATARAVGLTSRYSSGEAAGIEHAMTITKQRAVIVVTGGGQETRVKASALKAYVKGTKDEATKPVAKAMAELSKGLPGTVYGRKTAIFISVLAERPAALMLAAAAAAIALSCTGPIDEVRCAAFRVPTRATIALAVPRGCRVEQLEFWDRRRNFNLIQRSGEVVTERSLKVTAWWGSRTLKIRNLSATRVRVDLWFDCS